MAGESDGLPDGRTPGDGLAAPPAARAARQRESFIQGESIGVLARLLGSSRLFIGIAVAGLLLASAVTLVYGFVLVFWTIWHILTDYGVDTEGAKALSVEFVELTDFFLVGTVLYIVALGLYELFIDDDIPVPRWLHVDDLDDLKAKLVGVIIVLLGVNFLVAVVDWNGADDILAFGGAIALVILTLSVSTYLTSKQDH